MNLPKNEAVTELAKNIRLKQKLRSVRSPVKELPEAKIIITTSTDNLKGIVMIDAKWNIKIGEKLFSSEIIILAKNAATLKVETCVRTILSPLQIILNFGLI